MGPLLGCGKKGGLYLPDEEEVSEEVAPRTREPETELEEPDDEVSE